MILNRKMSKFAKVVYFSFALTLLASFSSANNQSIANATSNSTNTSTPPQQPAFETPRDALFYIQVIGCLAIMTTGTIGNLLVIIIFALRWSMLKTCEVFMVSLAVADLIGTFTVPLDMLRSVLQLHVPDDSHFLGCQLTNWLSTTCISVSALTLVTIAIDRFVVVAWPLKIRQGSSPLVICTIIMTWFVGGCMGAPYFVHLKQNYHPYHGYYCENELGSAGERQYYTSLFFLQVLLPAWAMTFLYSFIIFKLRSGSVSARRLSETDNVARIRTRRQRKATKLFIVVVIIFVSLVLPYNIISLLVSYNQIPPSTENRRIYVVLMLLLASNSCVNPIIYSRLHKSFRKSTIALLFGCCFQKYYRYEWDSKFISRSSYYGRRRYTEQSNTRSTVSSFRKAASPYNDDLATTCVSNGTPPRSVSGVSSRSSRISSSGSDDVFSRISSFKSGHKNEDSPRIQLQRIPEQNGSYVPLDRQCSGETSPVPKPGKYAQFLDQPIEGKDVNKEAFISRESPVEQGPRMTAEHEVGNEQLGEGKVHVIPSKPRSSGYSSLNSNEKLPTNIDDTEL